MQLKACKVLVTRYDLPYHKSVLHLDCLFSDTCHCTLITMPRGHLRFVYNYCSILMPHYSQPILCKEFLSR